MVFNAGAVEPSSNHDSIIALCTNIPGFTSLPSYELNQVD